MSRWGLAFAWSIPIMLGLAVSGVVSVPAVSKAKAMTADQNQYEFPGGL